MGTGEFRANNMTTNLQTWVKPLDSQCRRDRHERSHSGCHDVQRTLYGRL